jgi:hypothetical protein
MMTSQEAATVLRISLPTTENVVRTTFRRRARLEHPDVSSHPLAHDRFCRLQEAYQQLLEDPSSVEFSKKIALVTHTVDGIVLSELGKGLGPTINTIECVDCKGFGYQKFEDDLRGRCPICCNIFEPLRLTKSCGRCRGTGRFVRAGRDQGICFVC